MGDRLRTLETPQLVSKIYSLQQNLQIHQEKKFNKEFAGVKIETANGQTKFRNKIALFFKSKRIRRDNVYTGGCRLWQ